MIGPPADALNFLETSKEKYETQMRDLGLQPLTVASITVITSANVAIKAHSQLQAWALRLKDALEQAWVFTCQWLGQKKYPNVKVHTDFGVDMQAQAELEALQKARDARVISNKLHFEELKRRGVLSDDADFDDDQQEVAEEDKGLQPEQYINAKSGQLLSIDPATGKPVAVDPLSGKPIISKAPPSNGGAKPPPLQ